MREVRMLDRAGRRNQVLMAFAFQVQHGLGDEMTAYEIARKIDLRPQSPNFRDLLSQMVMDGVLKCREVESGRPSINGGMKFMYSPAVSLKPEKRSVAIRANGKQIGQLELF